MFDSQINIMIKKILFTLFLIIFSYNLNTIGQTYSQRIIYQNLGSWVKTSNGDVISIDSYITRQNIVTYDNYELRRRTISELPKYRYEIFITSNSKRNNKLTRVWLINTRITINNESMTNRQFPNGYSVIIDVKPTMIYWYETNLETINVELLWDKIKFQLE